MNETVYVSSVENRYSRAKLNNVIHSLDDFVSCTTNDKTEQEYGCINYCGDISIGQIIRGDKKPRRKDVPVVTTSNVFLGYLNEDGVLAVENNKQTQCITTNTYESKSAKFYVHNRTTVTDTDTCYEVSCCCSERIYYCSDYEVKEVTYIQQFRHLICCDLGMQYPSAIYCDCSCIGCADACYGITNECATGIACWYTYQDGHTTSATMAVANVSLETIDVCNIDMVSQVDSEVKSICDCYSANRSDCHLGVSLDITIDCCTVTSFWQKIVDKGCISMTYV